MPLLMVGVWALVYVAVYPWGDLGAGLGLVVAGAMGAWLGARRGGTAVAGWALAAFLAGGDARQTLAVALAQVATALVLGQLRDLRLTAEDEARRATSPVVEQLLRYCHALLRPDRADVVVLEEPLAEPGVRALRDHTVLVAIVDLDGEPIELAFERAQPFDADERAVLAMLLRSLDGELGRAARPTPVPTAVHGRERELLVAS